MRPGLLLRVALAASLALGSASLAYAQPSPADVAQARELGLEAQAAFEAGNYAESEKLWIAAERLYSAAPTLTLGLARTQAKLGKLILAHESYQKIIREQSDVPNLSPAFKDALEAAKTEIVPVAERIANVVITVEGAASPSVSIDGQPVPAAVLGLKRPVDPGSHTVRAEAPGYAPAETTFEVAEGGLAEAKLQLEKAPEAAAAPQPVERPPPERHKSSNKTLAIAAFGVGGAGLVLGAVTGLVALGKHRDLADRCTPDRKCPSTLEGEIGTYNTIGAVATVGFIVGAVGAAAGTVFLLTAPRTSVTGAARRASVAPFLGPGGAGVAGRF